MNYFWTKVPQASFDASFYVFMQKIIAGFSSLVFVSMGSIKCSVPQTSANRTIKRLGFFRETRSVFSNGVP